MLVSFALIFILSLILSTVFNKLKLPRFLGMLLTGIILSALSLIDDSILNISADLREIALIIILTRAGLTLDLKVLKKVGRPAILMSFVPALFEITAYIIFAPILFGLSITEAALMGCVLAAVSPAVILPRMIKLTEEKYGTKEGVPQLIMASASIDDVFVIVMFSAVLSIQIAEIKSLNVVSFTLIPLSILLGVVMGIIVGIALVWFFKKFRLRDSTKVIVLLSVSFLMVAIEDCAPVSGLVAVMAVGGTLLTKYSDLSVRMSAKFSKLWVAAEIILFVLVGANVDVNYAIRAGGYALLLILVSLCFRVFGVWLCLIKTKLNYKERLFCVFSFLPKATVQAAIGSVPLAIGLPGGEIILSVAVLGIIITAPVGAFLMDYSYKKLLKHEKS